VFSLASTAVDRRISGAMARDDDDDDTRDPRLFLVTYKPLVYTRFGCRASEAHGLSPFVDGSIRREPDLEHDLPAISCLCRAGKFAPRLAVGDEVVYLTAKGSYGEVGKRHWRLTAHLRVLRLFDAHAEAARWYEGQGLSLPNNCVVPGNRAVPLAHSHMRGRTRGRRAKAGACGPGGACGEPRRTKRQCGSGGGCGGGGTVHGEWDRIYRERAREHGRFVACEPLYVELSWDARVVHERDLRHAFGYLPGTRNPGAMAPEGIKRLMRRLGLPAARQSCR
jgi:hypothetical protein